MTAPGDLAAEGTGVDLASVAEYLLTACIDGDFLVGAGRSIGNEGGNVPINQARAKEVVWWAVDALAPLFLERVVQAEAEAAAYLVARRRLRHLHTELAGRRKDWANNTAQPCASARAVAYQSAMQSIGSILDEIEAIAAGVR